MQFSFIGNSKQYVTERVNRTRHQAYCFAKVDGKTVFVGYAGRYQPKQKDGFYTVFSQPSGLDLSGAEIGATAFANLLNMETLAPLQPGLVFVIIVLYGTAIALIFRLLPAYLSIATGLLAATIYFLFVYRMFADAEYLAAMDRTSIRTNSTDPVCGIGLELSRSSPKPPPAQGNLRPLPAGKRY